MKQPWLKNTINISSLFSFRMLGLFLMIPVFTVYADKLTGATPTLIGLALGCYGLTQSIFQIPLGILSDKAALEFFLKYKNGVGTASMGIKHQQRYNLINCVV